MALGGGTWVTQNKIMPGSYINIVSADKNTSTLGERGIVALPIALEWGTTENVLTIMQKDFQRYSMKLLGFDYMDDKLLPFREVFKHATKVLVYNIAQGGTKATCTYATAKGEGTRGNDLKIVIAENVDDETKFDVITYLGTVIVDEQTVSAMADLVENDYVTWKTDATLEATAGVSLTGGAGCASEQETANIQKALDVFEAYQFTVLHAPHAGDATINALCAEYTKRRRDQDGVKFQTVVSNVAKIAYDYEGVVSVANMGKFNNADEHLSYWVAGAVAGCAVNKSCTNMTYDGELEAVVKTKQTELEELILAGHFAFHKVDDEIRVLTDVNSLVKFTKEKGKDFQKNQVIRVIDERANYVARCYNNDFLGKVQNDKAGRVSFWNALETHARELEQIRAIQNYNSGELIVEAGEEKDAVVVNEALEPTVAMEKLYMTIVIK